MRRVLFVSVSVIFLARPCLHTAQTSFQDKYLNNTVVTINMGEQLTLNCRVGKEQVRFTFVIFKSIHYRQKISFELMYLENIWF